MSRKLRPSPAADRSALPALAVASALLAFEGLSVGLGAWMLRADDVLTAYVTRNELPHAARLVVFAAMGGGALLGCLPALVYLVWKRASAVPVLLRAAWTLGPLIPVGLLPMMLRWQLWQGDRMLTFLALTAVMGFMVRFFVERAMDQFPVASPGALGGSGLSPAIARRLPTLCVVLLALAYAAYFGFRTLEMHWSLRTSSLDLGLEENLVWNALHLQRPLFKSSPLAGPTACHFGYHATVIAYLIAPLYALYQHAETLLVIQAILIGCAAIPLYLVARRYLGPWRAVFIAAVYVCNPAVQGTNLYDFHYLPLGPFFLWMSLYALEARRNVLAVVSIVLTLAVREDVGAGLGIIGAYLLLTGRRPVAGLVTAAIGAAYFVVMKLVVMPALLQGSEAFTYMYQGLIPAGESGFGGVLKTAAANPAFTLASLLEEKKLVYVLQILVPLAFLPLRRPIGILCVLPGFVFTLLSTGYSPLLELGFQYPAHWNSFLFVALIANLAWTGRSHAPGDRMGRRRRTSWMAAVAVSTVVTTYHYGAVLQSNVARAGFGIANFGRSESDRLARRQVLDLIAKMPPRARVVASERLVPQLSNRPDAYTLRVGIYDADYLLLDMRGWSGEERTNAGKAFRDERFGVVQILGPFVLAKRGFESAETAAIAAQLQ